MAAHHHIDIGHEKAETTGDEKNQPDNHKEEKHVIPLTANNNLYCGKIISGIGVNVNGIFVAVIVAKRKKYLL